MQETTRKLSGKVKAQAAEIMELRRRSATPQSESASSDISPVNLRLGFNRPSTSDSYQRSSDRDDHEMDNPDDMVHNCVRKYNVHAHYVHVTI